MFCLWQNWRNNDGKDWVFEFENIVDLLGLNLLKTFITKYAMRNVVNYCVNILAKKDR